MSATTLKTPPIDPVSGPTSPPDDDEIYPLENGDRLTRAEFERRYDAMPELKKAELIEGVVYMGSPVSHKHHSRPHFHLIGWLAHYEAATPGIEGGDNASVRLDLDNMPQPDCTLFIQQEVGGQSRVDEDTYIEGAPELVAEVASSSASYDLGDKLRVYRRSGVKEYVVWRVRDRAIDWFALRDGEYVRLAATEHGILKSEIFPGLWLDPAALIQGNLARALAVLDEGIKSPEHAAFIARP
jgi:Uma2 family endonuclease